MIREIVIYGDPVLRKKGKQIDKITEEIRTLAEDMIETMHDAHGVGLAAQQVGESIQLTVIDVSDSENRPSRMWIDGEEVDPTEHMPLILLNPQLELSRENEIGPEGCLSFPEITADISRAERVKVTALDLEGKPVSFEAEGLLSRAVQHETDHLNGILFIDRMSSASKVTLGSKLKKLASGD
ncbi:MAG TPA: peptide deformylase [Chthoniobacterales bacterium]|jgi:peptide deformylase|nr:peptide deformylase [Chthoniobacterales bacterium]